MRRILKSNFDYKLTLPSFGDEHTVPVSSQFSEGFARVAKNRKQGFVDRKGRIAIPMIYDEALWFKKGLACVRLKKYLGLYRW